MSLDIQINPINPKPNDNIILTITNIGYQRIYFNDYQSADLQIKNTTLGTDVKDILRGNDFDYLSPGKSIEVGINLKFPGTYIATVHDITIMFKVK